MKKTELKTYTDKSKAELMKEVASLQKEMARETIERFVNDPKSSMGVSHKKTKIAQLLTIINAK